MKHLLTVNQLVSKHPCFTKGGMRYYIFNSQQNGLDHSGALLRIGRKILIEEEKFFNWVTSLNEGKSNRNDRYDRLFRT